MGTYKNKLNWLTGGLLITVLLSYFSCSFSGKKEKDDHRYKIYSSTAEERLSVELPDHSRVLLGTNTTLKVPKDYAEKSRLLILSGAAYFEIVPGTDLPLIVEAADMKISVSEASFFVRAYPYESGQLAELLKGTLKAEKAYHSTLENTPEILAPGEMVMLNKSVDLIEKETFKSPDREKWIKGELKFEQLSLYELTRVLEDWYGLPFEIHGAEKAEHKFSGSYKNPSLKQVFQDICKQGGCSFKVSKEKVVFDFD